MNLDLYMPGRQYESMIEISEWQFIAVKRKYDAELLVRPCSTQTRHSIRSLVTRLLLVGNVLRRPEPDSRPRLPSRFIVMNWHKKKLALYNRFQ